MTDESIVLRDRAHALARDIEEYAHYDGTEFGEVSMLLIGLSRRLAFLSDEFRDALIREMEDHLENYTLYSAVEETEEVTVRTVKTLTWA